MSRCECVHFALYIVELINGSDPTVKRVICKGCHIVLIPGASSTVRVKSAC